VTGHIWFCRDERVQWPGQSGVLEAASGENIVRIIERVAIHISSTCAACGGDDRAIGRASILVDICVVAIVAVCMLRQGGGPPRIVNHGLQQEHCLWLICRLAYK
jgi:hypothetical protein